MSELRIVVVGIGLGGKTHIRYIQENRDAVLDSIVAPINVKNSALAKENGVPIFSSLAECLKTRKPDAVIIASPNQVHAEQARFCIDSGLPILIEKPITSTVTEAKGLVDLVNSQNAKVLIGHHRAHNPILKKAMDVINDGYLGNLVSVIGSAQFYKPDHYFNDGPWRKEIGGGPILINLIHEIDNLRRLVGEICSVQAIVSNKTRSFAVEDTVAINFIFQNGVLGTFLLSDVAATAISWEQTTGENASYPNYPDNDCYLISGTCGSLSIPTMRLKYFSNEVLPSWWSPFTERVLSFAKDDPLRSQLQHFVEVIRGNELPIVTANDGYRNLLITEAIRKSAIEKTLIEV